MLLTLVYLALAVATASVTLTKGKVFQPLRTWIGSKSEWLKDLITCPYCTSHWMALGIVLIYQPVAVRSGFLALDLVVTSLVVVALASFSAGLIMRAFGPASS